MKTISITKVAEVPDGDYCGIFTERNGEVCKHIGSTTSQVGWEDGLGSPGSLTFYHCKVFDASLKQNWDKGLSLKKCADCLAAAGAREGGNCSHRPPCWECEKYGYSPIGEAT